MPQLYAVRLAADGRQVRRAYVPLYRRAQFHFHRGAYEATTSKINEEQLFYCRQRGIPTEEAVALIVNGYAKEVMNKLPMEFAVEARKLLPITLEGSVG